ncbi:MAG: hypothetical protein EHM14_04390 [Methanothrix sp.]|nr:MAG: hypothetical protein EHM14_04390 [Methanothrix sp.]
MREYTRYAVQELVQPLEFEKIISDLLFNLSQDSAFPERYYPDIRYIGGTKDFGHDAISIMWMTEENFVKTVFAFSKRKDWKTKLFEDLNKHNNDKNIKSFVFVTTERIGSWKLPEKMAELNKNYRFSVEIIDIEDIVIWIDNTPWGKSLKKKYCIDSEDVFIYLKPYEIALQNSERKEEFFRIRGPIEIDFIKGMVIRRDEVESIIRKLTDNMIHIILGPPASGKTVLTRNICYELNKIYDIYWLDMDDFIIDNTRVYLEIQRLNRTKSLVIVENGHKSIERLESLIGYFIDCIKTVKMLITARNFDSGKKRFHNIAQLTEDDNCRTEICASDIAEKLVLYYNSKFGQCIEKDINKFLYYKDDLWLLSYLFKAHIDKNEIDHNSIFQKVNEDLIEYNQSIGIGASDIILLISWITQNSAILSEEYGNNSSYLPIDDFFLIDKLGYDPAIVSSLIRLGIIKKANDGYWCWHTSLSKIYIKTAEIYPDLLSRINSKFKDILGDSFDEDTELDKNINIFHIYLLIHPEFSDRILRVSSESMLLFLKWPNILNNFDTRDLIYTNLRNGSLEQILSIVHIINIFSYRADNHAVYEELIDELGPDQVRDKICACRNPKEIASYAYLFYRMDKNIGAGIINEFKANIIRDFSKMSFDNIGYCMEFLFEINPCFAEEIIRSEHLIGEILVHASLSDTTGFLRDLNLIREIERKLYPQRGTNWLQACIEFIDKSWITLRSTLERDKEEEPIRTIISFISYISHIDMCKGMEAGNLVGKSYIISRLNEINSLSELRYAIFSIEHAYPELKDLILTEFVKFIESEIAANGIFSVAYFFGSLFKDSNLLENDKETIIQIVNRMDKDIVKTMKQSSIYPFCNFVELET